MDAMLMDLMLTPGSGLQSFYTLLVAPVPESTRKNNSASLHMQIYAVFIGNYTYVQYTT